MPDLWAARQAANGSRDWNGTLAAYCHVSPVEQNQNEKQKDSLRTGHYQRGRRNPRPPKESLFVSDMPHRLLLRVSLTEPTSAPLRF